VIVKAAADRVSQHSPTWENARRVYPFTVVRAPMRDWGVSSTVSGHDGPARPCSLTIIRSILSNRPYQITVLAHRKILRGLA